MSQLRSLDWNVPEDRHSIRNFWRCGVTLDAVRRAVLITLANVTDPAAQYPYMCAVLWHQVREGTQHVDQQQRALRAGAHWSDREDLALRRAVELGSVQVDTLQVRHEPLAEVNSISYQLGRSPGAIQARIAKLFGPTSRVAAYYGDPTNISRVICPGCAQIVHQYGGWTQLHRIHGPRLSCPHGGRLVNEIQAQPADTWASEDSVDG